MKRTLEIILYLVDLEANDVATTEGRCREKSGCQRGDYH